MMVLMVMELDADGLAEARESGETWIIDFWASWCGPCKQMAPIVEDVAEEVDGVRFGKVNIEDHSDLATEHGVRSIPTFIVLKDGEEVDRQMGAMPKQQFQDWIAEHA